MDIRKYNMDTRIPEWTVLIKCKLNEDPERVLAVLVTRDEQESREQEEYWQMRGFSAWREVQMIALTEEG